MSQADNQLTFDLPIRTAYGREDFFVSDSNEHAVKLMDAWPDWPSGVVCLTGPEGSGKTHLAKVWQQRSGARIQQVVDLNETIIPDLCEKSAVCLEDCDTPSDETAFFHLLNYVNENNTSLLLTARTPPNRWGVSLPDLKTRLSLVHVASLNLPDERLLLGVVSKHFSDRQIKVNKEILIYIINRIERNFDNVIDIVDRLDKTALVRRKPINLALVKEILAQV